MRRKILEVITINLIAFVEETLSGINLLQIYAKYRRYGRYIYIPY